jgi:hypothetical protein
MKNCPGISAPPSVDPESKSRSFFGAFNFIGRPAAALYGPEFDPMQLLASAASSNATYHKAQATEAGNFDAVNARI